MSLRVFVEVPHDDRSIEGVGLWQSLDGKEWAMLRPLDRDAAGFDRADHHRQDHGAQDGQEEAPY